MRAEAERQWGRLEQAAGGLTSSRATETVPAGRDWISGWARRRLNTVRKFQKNVTEQLSQQPGVMKNTKAPLIPLMQSAQKPTHS